MALLGLRVHWPQQNKTKNRSLTCGHVTHWGLDQMATMMQTTFSNTSSCLFKLLLKFPWSQFLKVKFVNCQGMAWHWKGTKPLSESVMNHIHNSIWHHSAAMSSWLRSDAHADEYQAWYMNNVEFSMVVADGLAPIWCHAISSYHTDLHCLVASQSSQYHLVYFIRWLLCNPNVGREITNMNPPHESGRSAWPMWVFWSSPSNRPDLQCWLPWCSSDIHWPTAYVIRVVVDVMVPNIFWFSL